MVQAVQRRALCATPIMDKIHGTGETKRKRWNFRPTKAIDHSINAIHSIRSIHSS
jgi:hypothetical protein